MVLLRKCEHELSYIIAELFNMCLKESCLLDCWKVSPVVPVFKNFWERSSNNNYCPVSLLSAVFKIFAKLENDSLNDHLKKYDRFPDFQCGFMASRPIVDLLIVYLTELLGLLIGLRVLENSAWYIQGFPQAVSCWSCSNSNLMQFQVGYLALFCFSSEVDGF